MMSCRKVLPFLLLSLCVLRPAQVESRTRTYESPKEKKVKKQQEENHKWEQEAKQKEADLVNEGNFCYGQIWYSKAKKCYENALAIRYYQWDIRETTVVGRTSLAPARDKKLCKLRTSYTRVAHNRLGSMDSVVETEKRNEANKEFRDLFEDAAIEIRLGNTLKAYHVYDEIVAKAEKIGKEKYALDNLDKAKKAQQGILSNLAKPLTEAEKLLKAKKPLKALEKIEEFEEAYKPFRTIAPELKERVDKLSSAPEIRHELKEQAVKTRITLGDAAVARKDYATAMEHYRAGSTMFLDTKAAAVAKKKLVELENDPNIAALAKQQKTAKDCEILLLRAKTLLKMGHNLEAQATCERIIENYPKSDWAKQAAELLKEIKEANKGE